MQETLSCICMQSRFVVCNSFNYLILRYMCWILTSAKLGARCMLGIHINDWEQHQQDKDFQSVQKNHLVKKSGSKAC